MQRFIPTVAVVVVLWSSGKVYAKEAPVKQAESAIRKALDEKTELDFVETPLQDAFEFISNKHSINVQLDKKAMDDAGLGSDTPISRILKDVSLRSALQLMLKDYDLTWVIDNEVLLITTLDEAGQRLTTRVYDVNDLVSTESGSDMDSLMDTITSNVAPTTWDEVGGPGSVSPFMGMLVFSQTQAVHEEVVSLLAELRRVRDARGDKKPAAAAADAPPADPKAVSVKVYKVGVPMVLKANTGAAPAATGTEGKEANVSASIAVSTTGGVPLYTPNDRYLQDLAQAIPALVRPESWERAGGSGVIHALPADANGVGQFLVRQTAEVHTQLQRFLGELPRATPDGGFGGGMGGGFF